MTEKDYKKAAAWLRDSRPDDLNTGQGMRWRTLVAMMASLFQDCNSKFSKAKFHMACKR